ncbi:hypothetical protein F4810DRAFT_449030 [Camillea tinctor]|nr:hypothetical protein F4810DRAFT_449030 [Camillea tinctor]
MANKSRIDRVFARLLMNHPYGWALYKKVSAKDLHPGTCGYFDSDGDWKILKIQNHLLDAESREPEPLTWGPKSSESVVCRQIGGSIGAPAMALPVEASVKLSVQCQSEEGAFIVTENPVLRHQIEDEGAAVGWVKANTAELVKTYKSIIDHHGIWIITKTYTSHRCAVAVMSSKSSSIELGISADIPGIFTFTPSSEWKSSGTDSAFEVHEDGQGVVAFISGIYFSKRIFGSELKETRGQDEQKKRFLRGKKEDIKLEEEEDLDSQEEYVVELFNCTASQE